MKTILKLTGISLFTLLIASFSLFLTGCDSVSSVEKNAPTLVEYDIHSEFHAKGGTGRWVAMVTGGGKNVNEGDSEPTEWISLRVAKDASGNVSGRYEYGNTPPLQEWRYHGSAECLTLSPDGTKAVVIGPVTHTQGPESPDPGTRIGFFIQDNGNGNKLDTAFAVFAPDISCDDLFNNNYPDFPGRTTSGNYSIRTR